MLPELTSIPGRLRLCGKWCKAKHYIVLGLVWFILLEFEAISVLSSRHQCQTRPLIHDDRALVYRDVGAGDSEANMPLPH
jgi:hypothetical protein